MVGQHSMLTVYSLLAKAGLWAWLWTVRASIGDPGDGSFGWVLPQSRPDGSVDVPLVNLGYLPWMFTFSMQAAGVDWVDPSGRTVHSTWIGPRQVKWVRMRPKTPIQPGTPVTGSLRMCTSQQLAWLRPQECHAYSFRLPWGYGGEQR